MKEKIINATLDLLIKEGESAITVTKICAQCHISRVSFYNYFNDVDDLMLYMQTNFLEEFNKMLKHNTTKESEASADPTYLLHKVNLYFSDAEQFYDVLYSETITLVEFFAENRKLLQGLRNTGYYKYFHKKVRDSYFKELILSIPLKMTLMVPLVTIKMYLNLFGRGLFSLIEDWVLSNDPAPMEKMCDELMEIYCTTLKIIETKENSNKN